MFVDGQVPVCNHTGSRRVVPEPYSNPMMARAHILSRFEQSRLQSPHLVLLQLLATLASQAVTLEVEIPKSKERDWGSQNSLVPNRPFNLQFSQF